MENSDIFNRLPDAICIIDRNGNIQRSNIQFERKIIRSTAVVNFFNDILHSQHQEQIGLTLEDMQKTNPESNACRALGLLNTVTMSEISNYFPVYQLINWSISRMSSCENFILSGRVSTPIESNPITTQWGLPEPKSNEPFVDMTSELADFFQNAPIALHWLSYTGLILWANNYEMLSLGYSSEEYIGHSITEFLMPGEEAHLQEIFTELVAGRTIRDRSFRFRAKNQNTTYLTVDSNVFFNADGSFRHTRCFLRNDTDRKVREHVLLESNRIMKIEGDAKSAFIAHVFNEMRSPLNTLSNFFNSNPAAHDFDQMKTHTDLTLSMLDNLCYFDGLDKLTPMKLSLY